MFFSNKFKLCFHFILLSVCIQIQTAMSERCQKISVLACRMDQAERRELTLQTQLSQAHEAIKTLSAQVVKRLDMTIQSVRVRVLL